MGIKFDITGVDLGFSEEGAKPISEAGGLEALPPEAIGCWVLKYQNLRFRADLMDF